jgi:Reverse transcriptase (RNA-dependent DNA polymerase)
MTNSFGTSTESFPLKNLQEHDGPVAIPNEPGADLYIHMEVGLRRDPELPLQRAKVKRRKLDESGTPMGAPHPTGNPLLDQRLYEVDFLDGTQETLAANILAESILAQVDEDGQRQLLLDEIIDHRRLKDAIPKDQGLLATKSGATRRIQTTRGWQFYVLWKDGSSTWVNLSDMKESYLIQTAQYARDHDLLEEPAFAWWARHALKKAHTTLSKVKSKYWEKTHKYGIRIPKLVKEAIAIDKENGDTMWMDAIRKEMTAIRGAMEEHDGDVRNLVGFQLITGHIVFDVKLGENFRRKARFCADGHKTKTPAFVTYSSVVSRDSVRIMLLIAALNGLSLKAADIQNAFLTAPNLEKVYIVAGPEFGTEQGKTFIIRKALYGLKSASAAFRAYLAEKLEEIGFKSSIADPDVWLRPASAPDGTEYYSYVLAYIDDILAIDYDPDGIMKQIGERFKFKNDAVMEPESYLGAKLQKRRLDNVDIWTMSSISYTDAALKNVHEQLKGTRWTLPRHASTPMPTEYHPELDETPLLDEEDKT